MTTYFLVPLTPDLHWVGYGPIARLHELYIKATNVQSKEAEMFVRKWDSWLADGLCLEFSRGGALACEVCPLGRQQSMVSV